MAVDTIQFKGKKQIKNSGSGNTSRGSMYYTCSYDEEKRAMVQAIDWVHHHCESIEKVAIFTDVRKLLFVNKAVLC